MQVLDGLRPRTNQGNSGVKQKDLWDMAVPVKLTIQTVSNHGVSHPVVARLSVQTAELIKFSTLSKQDQNAVCELYMTTLQRRLLKCHDIYARLHEATLDADSKAKEAQQRATGQIRFVPTVVGLDGEAEAFLYEVKNYLRDLLHLFRIMLGFDVKEIEASKLYDPRGKGDSEIVKWASAAFGDNDELTLLLRTEQPWVGQCIRKRNAVEHPGGKSGTLTICNVRAMADGKFAYPSWNLDNEPESDIYTDMRTMMHNMLTIAEDLLVICIKKRLMFPTVAFYEIAEEDRNREIPQRLRVGLSPELERTLAEKAAKDAKPRP